MRDSSINEKKKDGFCLAVVVVVAVGGGGCLVVCVVVVVGGGGGGGSFCESQVIKYYGESSGLESLFERVTVLFGLQTIFFVSSLGIWYHILNCLDVTGV